MTLVVGSTVAKASTCVCIVEGSGPLEKVYLVVFGHFLDTVMPQKLMPDCMAGSSFFAVFWCDEKMILVDSWIYLA